MNFQQLRVVREAARRNCNLTEAASALFTSQSGVSRHIKDLEDELGVELFVRRGKRLLGLTEPGKELMGIVERMLLDAKNIKSLGEEFTSCDHGKLRIATTHTQARYMLPSVVTAFAISYPDVELALHQARPSEIAAMLLNGEADIGIATEALQQIGDFATFPYYTWHHVVLVHRGHALEDLKKPSLAAIAAWPIITYTEGFTGRAKIDEAFARAGLAPKIVMSALDADVIKSYVELGMGVGIVAAMAYDPEKDTRLVPLKSTHLFESNTSVIALRKGNYLRGYAYRFLELCAPSLTEAEVRSALRPPVAVTQDA
jgi:LysR family cys regulon transcriptional activator